MSLGQEGGLAPLFLLVSCFSCVSVIRGSLFSFGSCLLPSTVREPIHHRREPTPRYTLRVSSLSTSPRKRSLPDNQRADLFIIGIDFQVPAMCPLALIPRRAC